MATAPEIDPEMAAFEASLLRSVDQARLGLGLVTTPADIKARRGRPVGSTQTSVKARTTLRLDPAALAQWRSSGKGWQTRAAEVLAAHAPK